MAPTLSPLWHDSAEVSGPALNADFDASPVSGEAWMHLRTALRLSDRELRIVQGVFADQEQDRIALALGISPELVYRTIQRIYIKLHIGSRLELKSKVRSEYLAWAGSRKPVAMTFGAGSV